MARLLRIEICDQCDHRGRYDDRCYGVYPHREFDDKCKPEIPDWCPLPELSGWIPVGERQPTERGTYEIAMPPLSPNEQHPHILVCEWAPAYGFHEEVCCTTFVYSADVLAWRPWQPLPALPEEASDDDRS